METSHSRRSALRIAGVSLLAVGATAGITACGNDGADDGHGTAPTSTTTQASSRPSATASPAKAGTVHSKASAQPLGLLPSSAKGGVVAGPHLALVVRAQTSAVLPSTWLRALGEASARDDVPAADNEEWLLLEMSASAPLTPTEKFKATAVLRAGAASVDIADLVGSFDKYVGFRNKAVVVAMSLPKGTPATLSIADQGKTASLTLPTFTLSDDADTAAMMLSIRRHEVAIAPAKVTWKGGWTDGRNTDAIVWTFDFNADETFFTPWSPLHGWAPQGRVWLLLKYRTDYDSKIYTSIELAMEKVSGISTSRSTIRPQPAVLAPLKDLANLNDSTLTFGVPVGFTGGTFTLRMPPTIPITYDNGTKASVNLTSSGPISTKLTAAWK